MNLADFLPVTRRRMRREVASALVADPNRVRAALTDANGDLVVNPRVLAATYSGLARSGRLEPAGWTESDLLTSRNRGRPQRRWRWLP